MEQNHFPYEFTIKSFIYNDFAYKITLTPELYREEDGLDFTGNYCVMMISELRGTMMLTLNVDRSKKWESDPPGLDPGLIDIIDQIIQDLRKN